MRWTRQSGRCPLDLGAMRFGKTMLDEALGHGWTIGPHLLRSFRARESMNTRVVRFELNDPQVGPVELSGEWLDGASTNVVIVLHGLGGNIQSNYMRSTLEVASRMGQRLLLVNLRGADRRGHDFHHAGLTADLDAVFASPLLERESEIAILGYSLGGHLALRYAALAPDRRLTKVAAICSPLDLGAAANSFDAPRWSVYRHHVMMSLYQIYTAAYQRNPTGISPLEARRITRIRAWDEAVVAPRFGFQGAEEYYRCMSAVKVIDQLKVDVLYVGALLDPMVPARAVKSALPVARLTECWVERGGHLGFRPDLDLDLGVSPRGLPAQVFGWLGRR